MNSSNEEDLQNEIFEIVSELLCIEKSEVTLELGYQSIPDWDSIAHLSIISKICECHQLNNGEEEEFLFCLTISDLLNKLLDLIQE